MQREKADLYSPFSSIFELTAQDFILKKQPKLKLPKNKPNPEYPQISHPNFKNVGSALVFFYAPWCGRCQKMTQSMSELAIQFKYIFPIGAVNCENEKNYPLCNSFQIEGFPTIFYKTPKNTLELYTGENNKDEILKFIYENTL